jgi:hypothetical protein
MQIIQDRVKRKENVYECGKYFLGPMKEGNLFTAENEGTLTSCS